MKRLKTERRLSPHTCEAYARDLRALLALCERERIAKLMKLSSFGVRRFAAESHRKGLSARSVARRLSAVRTFLNYLIVSGVVKSNAGVHVQAPKAPRRLPATLDADQMALVQVTKVVDEDPSTVDAATRKSLRQRVAQQSRGALDARVYVDALRRSFPVKVSVDQL